MTELGGSIMDPKVAKAMAEASQYFVHLPSLKKTIEDRIAILLNVESVHISSGASAGIILSAAACMTGTDPEKIKALPTTTGFPNVFLCPKVHRNRFDHAIHVAGGKIQEFELVENDFEQKLRAPDVVAVYFTLSWFCQGKVISIPQAAKIARKYNKPIIVDAAAQLPPLHNFNSILEQGADLVIFSGGKTINGPQASGLLLGRSDLIEACSLNNSPNIETIGRGMKVTKEDIVALFTAIDLYLQHDHMDDQKRWKKQLLFIKTQFSGITGLKIKLDYPYGPGYQVPYLNFSWKAENLGINAKQVLDHLINHTVPIYARLNRQEENYTSFLIYAHTLQKEEEKEIVKALKQCFKEIIS